MKWRVVEDSRTKRLVGICDEVKVTAEGKDRKELDNMIREIEDDLAKRDV
jgi:hypothetical protein